MNKLSQIGEAQRAYELLAKDCPFDQFLRELVVNAIQHGGARNVFIGRSAANAQKISVRDDGNGISDLEGSLQLFTKTQPGNYGVGGKISSLKRSPFGVEYQTRNGHRSGYVLRLNPSLLESGPVPATFIGEQGTEVILHGQSPNDETIRLPEHQGQKHWDRAWLMVSLNRRFWTIPKGVNVKAMDFSPSEEKRYRAIRGAKHYFEELSLDSGRIVLPKQNCAVLWYLLKDERREGKARLYNLLGIQRGATAILYENELYDFQTGPENHLQEFGILHVPSRFVLIVEPLAGMNVDVDFTRTSVYPRGEYNQRLPFAYKEIGAAFAARLPQAIVDVQEKAKQNSRKGTKRYLSSKLINLILPTWTALSRKGSRVVPASEKPVSGIGGGGHGEKENPGGGGKKVGIGDLRPGFAPDKKSKSKHRVNKGSGLPNIEVCGENSDQRFAFRFACADRQNFSDATLFLNEDWPGWKDHVEAVAAFGYEVPLETVKEKAVNNAKAAVYLAIGETLRGANAEALDKFASCEALTAVALSVRMQAADGAPGRKENR